MVMFRKTLVGCGFKMRKNVKDSVGYAKLLYDFVESNITDSIAIEVFILPSLLTSVLYQ